MSSMTKDAANEIPTNSQRELLNPLNTKPASPFASPITQNIVSTSNLGVELDLSHITTQSRNTVYKPDRFQGLLMRVRKPRTTALLYSTGKFVVTGAKSRTESLQAARKYAKIIKKIGYGEAKLTSFRVTNVVASCDFGFKINLIQFECTHLQLCRYEPEVFPGLVYSMAKPKVTMLISENGNITVNKAKSMQDVHNALDILYPKLKHLAKSN